MGIISFIKKKYNNYKLNKHYNYLCNIFRNQFRRIANLWHNEFSGVIRAIKTPKQVEDNITFDLIANNVETVEDAYA